MSEELSIQKPAWKAGWYWFTGEEGYGDGPYSSHDEAAEAMWQDGFGQDAYHDMVADLEGDEPQPTKEEFLASYEWIWHAALGPISTDIFEASAVLETLEDKHEFQVWGDQPPEWPKGEAARELEKMLGDALYRWLEKHDLWKQFRSLS